MSRIEECWPNAVGRHEFIAIRYTHKLTDGLIDIGGGVQRLDRRFPFFCMLPAHVFGVAFLEVGTVVQHDVAEVFRRSSGIDGSFESASYEVWKISCMVDMRVGQDNSINRGSLEREVPITLI